MLNGKSRAIYIEELFDMSTIFIIQERDLTLISIKSRDIRQFTFKLCENTYVIPTNGENMSSALQEAED